MVGISPAWASALQQRGRADEARQVLTEAVAVLSRTISARPNDYYARINLGNAFLDLDRLDDALAMYREAARIRPGDARAPVAIGTALNLYKAVRGGGCQLSRGAPARSR